MANPELIKITQAYALLVKTAKTEAQIHAIELLFEKALKANKSNVVEWERFKFTLDEDSNNIEYTAVKSRGFDGKTILYYVSWTDGNQFVSQLHSVEDVESYVEKGIWKVIKEMGE